MLNLRALNPQQRLAVETVKGPVLILAGAGTGKTRVITCRVAHLIERGIPQENILAVTFTNKAAREMRERVTDLVPRSTRQQESRTATPGGAQRASPTLCTFHSLCARILRQHIDRLGYRRNFVIYNESEQLGAIRKILAQISAKGEKTDPASILSLLSRFKNGGARAAVFADESVRAMAEHVRARYESALRACNAVDFDDLILLTLRLFDEHREVLAACRDKYRYVMVDEYQDTNAAQFRLVYALTREHRNLCVVGDDDQSIYGWRGAEISNLLDMEKHFPETKVIRLEQNYRSTNTILQAANTIIQHNAGRRGKRLWSERGEGARITLHSFSDEEAEARGITEQIEYLRLGRRVPWSEQAILFRINAQSRPLETALRQAGVPYRVIGGQSFFDRREVRDFMAFLKTFLNPHDDVSLLRIANVPARGLSDATMERLLAASHERKCSVYSAMKNPAVAAAFPSRTRGSVEGFVQLIEQTRRELGAGPDCGAAAPSRAPRPATLCSWAEGFLDEIGYFTELRRLDKTAAAEHRLRGLKELVASLDAASALSLPLFERLQAFVEEITLDTEREEEEEDAGNAVTLITMHSCKGLEFPHVYVVGMEAGLLPHSRSQAEGTLDEERRLFYVAITRAMRTLDISHCTGRRRYGQRQPCDPSPFLKELPPELVEHADAKAKVPVTPEAGKSLFSALRAAVG